MNQPPSAAATRGACLTALLSMVAERGQSYHQAGQLDDEAIAAMKAAGVFRALVPRMFGGDDLPLVDFFRLVESISTADGSAGWVASFGIAHISLSALPEDTLKAIYVGGPDVVYAGALYPPQPPQIAPGGYVVSGRWSFGSGSPGADLIGVGIKGDDTSGGLSRMAVIPAEKVRIVANWDVIGMRGTGSHDLVVDKVFVPAAWTFVPGSAPSIDRAICRYPLMALAGQVLAVVGLGVARASLETLKAMAGRASITGAPAMAERAHVQIELAKTEAALRSARAFLYEATQEACDMIAAGGSLDTPQKALIRLSATQAAHTAAYVTRIVFAQAGTAGIFAAHPLSRQMQDAAVVAQHAILSEGTWQSAGRALLGLEGVPGFP